MKTHLVNLLFEECKLRSFVDKLCSIGVDIDALNVNNHQIILDMIGFPKDNKHAYIQMMGAEKANLPFATDPLPNGYYSREKLTAHFYDTVIYFNPIENIELTKDGLEITKAQPEKQLIQAITEHIDWLYNEYAKINSTLII